MKVIILRDARFNLNDGADVMRFGKSSECVEVAEKVGKFIIKNGYGKEYNPKEESTENSAPKRGRPPKNG